MSALSTSTSVLHVLSMLEELPFDATGALTFGDDVSPAGVVFVEQGRVCWAASTGLRRRLTDLLRERCMPPLSRDQVEGIVQGCCEKATPIGEALVASGHLAPGALRSSLLHHTTESLAAISVENDAPRWVPHRARGYQSAFTFLPAELVECASTLDCGSASVAAAAQRLELFAGDWTAAVFDGTAETLLVCRLCPEGRAELSALKAAGAWAAESLSERFDAVKFTFDGAGGTWVGWRDDDFTSLAHCRQRDDFSVLVRRLQQRGFSAAVRSEVPLIPRVTPVPRQLGRSTPK